MLFQNQKEFFQTLKELSKEEKKAVLDMVHKFSLQDVLLQQEALHVPMRESKALPLKTCEKATGKYRDKGKEALKNNKVACVILAAGDGSRLNFKGPKGSFPIMSGKSFFQIFAGKIAQLKNTHGCSPIIAVMCSDKNLCDTIEHFEKNHFFHLEQNQVVFFPSKGLPLLDEKGNWFLNEKKQIAVGPSGNGEVFSAAEKVVKKFKNKNVEHISVIQVDNPLADPFDEELLGYHLHQKNEVTLKCFMRDIPEEKLGVLANCKGSITVKEYLHLPDEVFTEEGLFNYPFANVGNYFFSLSFFEKMEKKILPFHLSKKKAIKYRVGNINMLKCERFIFDVLSYSKKTGALSFSKKECFAPLKSLSDLVNVQNLLLKKEKVVQ
ncbi:MAG: UTP--glucose-1-phosphate uridylyltransferase [Chlamydiota bacterium]|jgi:UDP-N-acetylglucosamine/UDP-N-acetylgalactosamine diphosphorylase